jgi:hypothetical protein
MFLKDKFFKNYFSEIRKGNCVIEDDIKRYVSFIHDTRLLSKYIHCVLNEAGIIQMMEYLQFLFKMLLYQMNT